MGTIAALWRYDVTADQAPHWRICDGLRTKTMAAFVLQEHLAQQSFDPPVGPAGDQRWPNPQNKPLRTADGWISVTINTDPQVRAFPKAVGRDHLLDDPRFTTVAARAIEPTTGSCTWWEDIPGPA